MMNVRNEKKRLFAILASLFCCTRGGNKSLRGKTVARGMVTLFSAGCVSLLYIAARDKKCEKERERARAAIADERPVCAPRGRCTSIIIEWSVKFNILKHSRFFPPPLWSTKNITRKNHIFSLHRSRQLFITFCKQSPTTFQRFYRFFFNLEKNLLRACNLRDFCFYLVTEKVLITRLATQRWLDVGPEWTEDEHRSAYSKMIYEYRVTCSAHYYGKGCENLCRPRDDSFGHYSCSRSGERVCLSGWQGEYCATRKYHHKYQSEISKNPNTKITLTENMKRFCHLIF